MNRRLIWRYQIKPKKLITLLTTGLMVEPSLVARDPKAPPMSTRAAVKKAVIFLIAIASIPNFQSKMPTITPTITKIIQNLISILFSAEA